MISRCEYGQPLENLILKQKGKSKVWGILWSPEIRGGLINVLQMRVYISLKRYQPLLTNIPVQKSEIKNQKPRIQFIAPGDNRKTIEK